MAIVMNQRVVQDIDTPLFFYRPVAGRAADHQVNPGRLPKAEGYPVQKLPQALFGRPPTVPPEITASPSCLEAHVPNWIHSVFFPHPQNREEEHCYA